MKSNRVLRVCTDRIKTAILKDSLGQTRTLDERLTGVRRGGDKEDDGYAIGNNEHKVYRICQIVRFITYVSKI